MKETTFTEVLMACAVGAFGAIALYGFWAPHDLIRILNDLI